MPRYIRRYDLRITRKPENFGSDIDAGHILADSLGGPTKVRALKSKESAALEELANFFPQNPDANKKGASADDKYEPFLWRDLESCLYACLMFNADLKAELTWTFAYDDKKSLYPKTILYEYELTAGEKGDCWNEEGYNFDHDNFMVNYNRRGETKQYSSEKIITEKKVE